MPHLVPPSHRSQICVLRCSHKKANITHVAHSRNRLPQRNPRVRSRLPRATPSHQTQHPLAPPTYAGNTGAVPMSWMSRSCRHSVTTPGPSLHPRNPSPRSCSLATRPRASHPRPLVPMLVSVEAGPQMAFAAGTRRASTSRVWIGFGSTSVMSRHCARCLGTRAIPAGRTSRMARSGLGMLDGRKMRCVGWRVEPAQLRLSQTRRGCGGS